VRVGRKGAVPGSVESPSPSLRREPLREPESTGLEEIRVAAFQAGGVGAVFGSVREAHRLAVDLLEANDEHRAVVFEQDARSDLDPIVGPDREEESSPQMYSGRGDRSTAVRSPAAASSEVAGASSQPE
jgi:hypothetical protein